MELPSRETLSLLFFLLPGFVAAWVFYGLTAHPRKDTLERVIQALIFTVIVRACVIGTRKAWWLWWHPPSPVRLLDRGEGACLLPDPRASAGPRVLHLREPGLGTLPSP